MSDQKAFISSSCIDLPEHRRQVVQACLELQIRPDGLERWPLADSDATAQCLDKLDSADLFIGVYAHRYGWVPPGHSKSISELEYDRALARGLPRLIFLIGDEHAIRARDRDDGACAEALRRFKARIQEDRICATFDNPDQLRAEVLHALSEAREARPQGRVSGMRVELARLPRGADHFIARETELATLDAAWKEPQCSVVAISAAGGAGKTSLVKCWLEGLRSAHLRGVQRAYGWSFNGAGDESQAVDEHFFSAALAWFGLTLPPCASPWDKGLALAAAVAASRTLLVLDGLDALQYPSGPLAGTLRTPGLKTLLSQLARSDQLGLCVTTSRLPLADLADFERRMDHPAGKVHAIHLDNLSPSDGASLLHALGANRSGTALITRNDAALTAASRDARGHALTLSLLARFLAVFHSGDIGQRNLVDLGSANSAGHPAGVLKAFAEAFAGKGQPGARELATLQLLGLFSGPACAASFTALLALPAIRGLTEPLAGMSERLWRITLKRLQGCGLLSSSGENSPVDAHPLLRAFFTQDLREQQPQAWREAQRRLYAQFKDCAPQHAEAMIGLQPLYRAVFHGCQAGMQRETWNELLAARIARQHSAITTSGDAELGALACFFDAPWQQVSPQLAPADQARLLAAAAERLQAIGRVDDALTALRAAAQTELARKDWSAAARRHADIGEFELCLGHLPEARRSAGAALTHAERSGEGGARMAALTTIAQVLFMLGDTEAAGRLAETETLAAQWRPDQPLLTEMAGYRLGEQRLAAAERAAWQIQLGAPLADPAQALQACTDMTQYAALEADAPPLALLTLARSAFYAALLQGRTPAREGIDDAVAALRAAGSPKLATALLSRAWLLHALNDTDASAADLAEARLLAGRGNLKLVLIDILLTRVRLLHDRQTLATARKLIDDHHYFRRQAELEDAEAALAAV
jgi:hypothetical protein